MATTGEKLSFEIELDRPQQPLEGLEELTVRVLIDGQRNEVSFKVRAVMDPEKKDQMYFSGILDESFLLWGRGDLQTGKGELEVDQELLRKHEFAHVFLMRNIFNMEVGETVHRIKVDSAEKIDYLRDLLEGHSEGGKLEMSTKEPDIAVFASTLWVRNEAGDSFVGTTVGQKNLVTCYQGKVQ